MPTTEETFSFVTGQSPRAFAVISQVLVTDEFNSKRRENVMPRKSKNSSVVGQHVLADKADTPMLATEETHSSVAGQSITANATAGLPATDELVARVRFWHRQRMFGMKQRKSADLALGSFLRTQLGWRKDLPEAERKAIAVEAAALIKNPVDSPWESIIAASNASRAPFDEIEANTKKQMTDNAKQLSAWKEFGESILGFGLASFATIIGEAGDLSRYSNHSKLWKRMGLAVMDGKRQGAPGTGASAEDWIRHGYSPLRRSHVWNIGDTMLKAQIRVVKDAAGEDTGERISRGEYGAIYLARKAYEIAREPEIKPIVAHRRAQRYMEKRLLRNLWRAWRRATDIESERTKDTLPVATLKNAA